MKKQYIAPELELIIFNLEDIITHSNATEDDTSSDYDFGDYWGDLVNQTFYNGVK